MTLLTSMNWSTFLTVLKTDPTQQLFKKILKVEDNRPIYIRKIHKPGLSKVDQFRRWIVFTPTRSNGKPADYNHFKIYCPRLGHLNCSHTNPSLISAHNIKLLIAPDPPPQIIFKSAPSPIKNSRLISLGLTKDAKKSTIKEVLRNKAMLNDLP